MEVSILWKWCHGSASAGKVTSLVLTAGALKTSAVAETLVLMIVGDVC